MPYRVALRLARRIVLPVPAMNPCDTGADKTCLTAWPVLALSRSGYDVPSCKAHIDTDAHCRKACRVRMACPVSQTYSRDPAQTAFHMEAFHPS